MLDKRLSVCYNMVNGDFVCDIGTDHAYLVAELLKTGKCSKAIAADINEKPLESAKTTLLKYDVSDKAQTILSDGLKNIKLDGITDIVIAGMGGELIANIISERKKELSQINLILQPMTQAPFLRRWLAENGFDIKIEKAVIDGHHYYTIMSASYSGVAKEISLVSEQIGLMDLTDEISLNYVKKLAERFYNIGCSLRDSKNYADAVKNISLSYILTQRTGGKMLLTVNDIMAEMDKIAPLSILQKGDNSGLIVGRGETEVKKILLALDITTEVVKEAIQKGANVIISHHPIIFHPLYTLNEDNPACLALKNDITCICFHSPLDMADGGINDIIYDMLKNPLELSKKLAVLEPIHPDGRGYGMICEVGKELKAKQLAELLKKIFNCTIVRFTDIVKPIKKIAFCSGGAGGNLPLAINSNADAYITGDVKHDQWITATNSNIALFDCGHFHTEVIVLDYLKKCFLSDFPELDIEIAEKSSDPVEYSL